MAERDIMSREHVVRFLRDGRCGCAFEDEVCRMLAHDAAQRARIGGLEAALRGIAIGAADERPCWCSGGWDHEERCLAARRVLGIEEDAG